MAVARATSAARLKAASRARLLSVIYMNRFLKHWRLTKRGEAFHAHVVAVCRRLCATNALTKGSAVLCKRWRQVLRSRPSGAGSKPPQAATVKSRGGERCGKGGNSFRQVWLRETSESKPPMTCRKRIDDNPQTVQLAPLIEEVIGTARQLASRTITAWLSRCRRTSAF